MPASWACPMPASPPFSRRRPPPSQDRRLSLHPAHPGLGVVRVDERGCARRRHSRPLIEGAHRGGHRRPLPRPCGALPGAAAPRGRHQQACGQGLQDRPRRARRLWRTDEKPEIVALSKVDALSRAAEAAEGALAAGGEEEASFSPPPRARACPRRCARFCPSWRSPGVERRGTARGVAAVGPRSGRMVPRGLELRPPDGLCRRHGA